MRNLLFVMLMLLGLVACGGTDDSSPQKNQMPENVLTDFSDLNLETGASYIGADGAGGFDSGALRFKTNYNAEYKSWDGFAYTNQADLTTVDFANLSAMSQKQDKPGMYAVGFVNGMTEERPKLWLANDESEVVINGLYVTNTAYTYHVIKDGNAFAKKFGGADGTEADWFALTIRGLHADGTKTAEAVTVYLADYRFEKAEEDYILSDWTFVDLASLGSVSGLTFDLSSSDVGAYGMNTPTFFAIDEITRKPAQASNE